MSVSPIIYLLRSIQQNSNYSYLKEKVFPIFLNNLKKYNLTTTEIVIKERLCEKKENDLFFDFANISLNYNLKNSLIRFEEGVHIDIEKIENIFRYNVMPSSTCIGYDVDYAGEKVAEIQNNFLRTVTESLYNAAKGEIVVSSIDEAEPPNTIQQAIQLIPASKFSLVRTDILPGIKKYLELIGQGTSLALDWGDYIEFSAGPYPFGLKTHEREAYQNQRSPNADFYKNLHLALRNCYPELID